MIQNRENDPLCTFMKFLALTLANLVRGARSRTDWVHGLDPEGGHGLLETAFPSPQSVLHPLRLI